MQQVLLLRNDTRQVRDDKLEHLAAHCGKLVNPFRRPEEFLLKTDPRQANVGLDRVYWPRNRIHGSSTVGHNYIVFYLTEMWPGGDECGNTGSRCGTAEDLVSWCAHFRRSREMLHGQSEYFAQYPKYAAFQRLTNETDHNRRHCLVLSIV